MTRKIVISTLLIVCIVSSFYVENVNSENPEPFFYISLLSPNTNPARNQWSIYIQEQLPAIGIGISHHESTGWANIYPRTWEFPVGVDFDYIPTYGDGGYDILFVGWSWGLDWDPTGLFDTAGIVPAGDNHYQYSNAAYDSLLVEYKSELDDLARIPLSVQMQNILYEDLPAISLAYLQSLFCFKNSLTGIDPLLLYMNHHQAEYWSDPDDNIIIYANPNMPNSYNSFEMDYGVDLKWGNCIYGGLFHRIQGSHYNEPYVASNYVVSNDNLQINVSIDPNAKFSNGDAVLAEDIKYTYELHMTPSVNSNEYWLLTNSFGSNETIVVLDPLTIQFNFQSPNNIQAKEIMSMGIIDKSVVEPLIASIGYSIFYELPFTGNVGDALVTSCGPFMMSSYAEAENEVTLNQNPFWHRTIPSINTLIITHIAGKDTALSELASGGVDIIDTNYLTTLEDIEGLTNINPVTFHDLRTQEMSINMLHPILGTGELTPLGTVEAAKAVRKAISHAINREFIVNEIIPSSDITTLNPGFGSPGIIPMPKACIGFDYALEPYEYNLDLAMMYLEEAGYYFATTNTTSPTSSTTTSDKTTAGIGNEHLMILSFLALTSILLMKRLRK